MRRAKQVVHAAISCCFASSICQLKVKVLHHFCLPLVNHSIPYENQCILACGKYWRVTIENHILCEMWFRWRYRWTNWPSSRSNKSCQAVTCGNHLKSYRNITSVSSAPIKAKLVVAGLVNVCKMLFSGFKREVFFTIRGTSQRYISVFTPSFAWKVFYCRSEWLPRDAVVLY